MTNDVENIVTQIMNRLDVIEELLSRLSLAIASLEIKVLNKEVKYE